MSSKAHFLFIWVNGNDAATSAAVVSLRFASADGREQPPKLCDKVTLRRFDPETAFPWPLRKNGHPYLTSFPTFWHHLTDTRSRVFSYARQRSSLCDDVIGEPVYGRSSRMSNLIQSSTTENNSDKNFPDDVKYSLNLIRGPLNRPDYTPPAQIPGPPKPAGGYDAAAAAQPIAAVVQGAGGSAEYPEVVTEIATDSPEQTTTDINAYADPVGTTVVPFPDGNDVSFPLHSGRHLQRHTRSSELRSRGWNELRSLD